LDAVFYQLNGLEMAWRAAASFGQYYRPKLIGPPGIQRGFDIHPAKVARQNDHPMFQSLAAEFARDVVNAAPRVQPARPLARDHCKGGEAPRVSSGNTTDHVRPGPRQSLAQPDDEIAEEQTAEEIKEHLIEAHSVDRNT
jgi:hypothetical protein